MRIVLAEYATGTCINSGILAEGRAILRTLAASFERTGHEVVYPSAGSVIGYGTSVQSDEETFSRVIEREAKRSDLGLVIAPDHILPYFTSIIEDNTVNLGCTPESVQICADKLRCSHILEKTESALHHCSADLMEDCVLQNPGTDVPVKIQESVLISDSVMI